jgi:hypothetical protein
MVQSLIVDILYFRLLFGLFTMASPALFLMFASALLKLTESHQKCHLGHYIGLGWVCISLGIDVTFFATDRGTTGVIKHTGFHKCQSVQYTSKVGIDTLESLSGFCCV